MRIAPLLLLAAASPAVQAFLPGALHTQTAPLQVANAAGVRTSRTQLSVISEGSSRRQLLVTVGTFAAAAFAAR
jgi:hypothetical protein